MKIALCFSGQARTLNLILPNLKKYILNPLNPDVFIHTWSGIAEEYHLVKGSWGNQWLGKMGWARKKSWFRKDRLEAVSVLVDAEELKSQLSVQLKPKIMLVENYQQKSPNFVVNKYHSHKKPETNPERVLAMHYSIQQANLLKKQQEILQKAPYDWVIRCRLDLNFKKPIPLKTYSSDKLYIPNTTQDFEGVNDQLAFGASHLMDIYASAFDHLDSYWENGCIFHPERLLKHHLQTHSVPLVRPHLDYSIQRKLLS